MKKILVEYLGATKEQISWGSNDDPRKLLKIGDLYIVKSKEVHSWHTKIVLAKFPDKKFNSASFRNIE